MMKALYIKSIGKVFFLLFVCNCAVLINAQTSVKLPTTTIIGTTLSVDYSTNNPSTTVNTKSNVFDGDLNTYFASYDRSGTWVGLDLGEKYIITTIKYAPRNDFVDGPKRLVLGVFEGASRSDFRDAVPLLVVTEAPPMNVLTEQTVICSKGFRYVRYVGPNDVRCNIAEIEFYGYKGEGDNSHLPQLTNLPTITIHTDNAVDITSETDYVQGYVSFIYNDGKTIYSDNLDIRGRGHASWGFPKKPYRMKLNSKVNLMGFPAKEKSWTLINNYGDKTLMRNLLAFDLSIRMEMAYTSVGIPVDVILNGEYKGCYQLCDQVEVAPDRVNVQALTAGDIALPNLSGGYMLEVDAYAGQDDEDVWFTSANRYTPVKIRSPKSDEIVQQQYDYIHDYYNKMEAAVFSTNYKDALNGYRKYIDTESFIRHFLVGEISGNTDTYWSTYMYKDRNNDIFYFGPVWDFDLAYENDNRTYPINSHTQWVYEYGSAANGFRDVVNRLFTDDYFVSRLKAIYAEYRDRGLLTKEALLQVVDDYASEIYQSQQLNFTRWDIMNALVHQNPRTYGSYEGEVNNVKNYISARIDWMDKKLNYTPKTNIPEISNLSDIVVYAQANTICIDNVLEPVNITIADITGRMIFSKSIKENTSIPVSSKGIYVVSVSDAKGNQRTVKCLAGM